MTVCGGAWIHSVGYIRRGSNKNAFSVLTFVLLLLAPLLASHQFSAQRLVLRGPGFLCILEGNLLGRGRSLLRSLLLLPLFHNTHSSATCNVQC